MNITFIIGNGFDVSLGLKTQYKNFYPYYLQNTNDDNIIRKAIEQDKKENYKNWADLEYALGEFTEQLKDEEIEEFIQAKIHMDKLLKGYLVNEEEQFVLNEDDDRLKCALSNIRKTKVEKDNQKLNDLFKATKGNNYDYRAITFNYTNAFDKVWDVLKGKEVARHNNGNNVHAEKVGGLLHIHGTLYDNEMIVGINDKNQIKNEQLRIHKGISRVLVKPLLNNALGQNKIEKACDIIDGSMLICLYGVSIGETDQMWWEYIGNWLKSSINRILIIYNYEPEYFGEHIFEIIEHRDKVKEKFLDRTKLTEQEKDGCRERIIVRDNENLFSK